MTTDHRIHVLDTHLANQIAAGEVVERPSSIVKELLDNAIDAQASHIVVEITDAGLSALRVTDNGIGMGPHDARNALSAHATSKIKALDDLGSLNTLGFRGEALPSIASVAELTLRSRLANQSLGTEVQSSPGEALRQRDVGCNVGTHIEVRNLFAKVPARRKFLRSTPTESMHCVHECTRVALIRPQLHLRLLRDERCIREYLPVQTMKQRLPQMLGEQEWQEFRHQAPGIRLQAWFAPLNCAKKGSAQLYTYVNQRSVRDRRLLHALSLGTRDLLPPGHYPAGVVCLEINPAQLDVNVHPQKLEVRFADEAPIMQALHALMVQVHYKMAQSKSATRPSKPLYPAQLPALSAIQSPKATPPKPSAARSQLQDRSPSAAYRPTPLPAQAARPTPNPPAAEPTQDLAPEPAVAMPEAGFVSVLRQHWLVAQTPEAMVVLDRRTLEVDLRLREYQEAQRQGELKQESLLFPERVAYARADCIENEAIQRLMHDLGFDMDKLAPETLRVRSVPALLKHVPLQKLLPAALDVAQKTPTLDPVMHALVQQAVNAKLCPLRDARSAWHQLAQHHALNELAQHPSTCAYLSFAQLHPKPAHAPSP